jgi:hypothetical protein
MGWLLKFFKKIFCKRVTGDAMIDRSVVGSGIVISPFFIPVISTFLFQFVINLLYIFVPLGELDSYIVEGGLLSKLTTMSYVIIFIAFIVVFSDFLRSGYLCEFFIFLLLALGAFAREHEWVHWFLGQDVALNLKFIVNSSDRILERVLIVLILLLFIFALAYLARKYAVSIVIEFFNFGILAWSFAAFVFYFLLGQVIDLLPKVARFIKFQVSEEFYLKLEVIEESTEFLLPIIVAMIFVQYHCLLKVKKANNSKHQEVEIK